MVNHLYGNRNKPLRNQINKQRKDMGIDKFEGLLPDWQGKTTYYNHIPKFNTDGELAKPCGSAYPNQPSDPSTQQRRGAIGLFPIEWDGKCRLEVQGKPCVCKPTTNVKKTESTPKEKPVITKVTKVDTEE